MSSDLILPNGQNPTEMQEDDSQYEPLQEPWEYCVLECWGRWYTNGNWKADLTLKFMRDGGYSFEFLSGKKDDPKKKGSLLWEARRYDPWLIAFGQLGAGGWELVSVEHGLRIETGVQQAVYESGRVRSDNSVAYFKRRIRADRPMDAPKVNVGEILSFEPLFP